MQTTWRYFRGSFIVTIIGLAISFAIGFKQGDAAAGLSTVLICLVLGVLEVSLSFDNAVVNATVLNKMTQLWRQRFLTWGILIAVFGMRLVFPLAIVGIIAHVNPIDAVVLAATDAERYAEIMRSVHVPIAGFGGAFLMMVALRYFLDVSKDVHWIRIIEAPLTKIGRLETVELAIGMVFIYLISLGLEPEAAWSFLVAGLFGLVTFILVDGLSALLEGMGASSGDIHKASLGMFLYLEVLDASFSFDGVVGAFAITNSLFIIAIGLGIGAMFVRSLTVLLVDRKTLTQFIYLEHGAFYAIAALAAIMFIGTFQHIPEVITGLIGAAFIGLSLLSSIRHARRTGDVVVEIDGNAG